MLSRMSSGRGIKLLAALAAGAVVGLASAAPAPADVWFPHPSNATWEYTWQDSAYNPTGTTEDYTVEGQTEACGWNLSWSSPSGTQTQTSGISLIWPDSGTICFTDQNYGLVNTDWSSTPPPPSEPVLCPWQTDPSSGNPCPNSLSGALFNAIWGSRSPVLSEPLLRGTTWNSTGGFDNSVTSTNQYLGLTDVKVPAFPNGVFAAMVRSQITQAGALGDPYGSGTRTTWWVDGVGPVLIRFQHAGGSSAPETEVTLQKTNLNPQFPPPDQNYFPMGKGIKGTYKWTNKKHLPQPEIEKMSVDAVANRSERLSFKSVSGPIRAAGVYGFSTRLDGVTQLFGSSSGATIAKLPKLGHGRHFFTPYDMVTFGFNPLLPAYPIVGSTWKSGNLRDLQIFGVTGTTTVVGVRTVTVPAGTFKALELRSTLTQVGYRFGSGVRTMWFAPARGLVKLVFQHRDGSTSVISLIR
jgi:hypothetical protein